MTNENVKVVKIDSINKVDKTERFLSSIAFESSTNCHKFEERYIIQTTIRKQITINGSCDNNEVNKKYSFVDLNNLCCY